jgi:hypothetical protein
MSKRSDEGSISCFNLLDKFLVTLERNQQADVLSAAAIGLNIAVLDDFVEVGGWQANIIEPNAELLPLLNFALDFIADLGGVQIKLFR